MHATHLMTLSGVLFERPELERLAIALGLDIDSVVGKVVRVLWWYRNEMSAIAVAVELDALVGRQGFVAALCDPAIGWFAGDDAGLVRPRGFLRDEVGRMHHTKRVRAWRKKIGATSPVKFTGEVHLCTSQVKVTGEPVVEPVVEAVVVEAVVVEEPAPIDKDIALEKHQLPEWVPVEVWKEFIVMRRKQKHPLTEHAKTLAIKRLAVLRFQGEDVRAVLEQSIMRGWCGLFDTKAWGFPGGGKKPAPPPTNFNDLDFQNGATRAEDLPGWAKDDS